MIYVLYIYSKITNKISLRIKLNLLVQIKKKTRFIIENIAYWKDYNNFIPHNTRLIIPVFSQRRTSSKLMG